jgi:hypothetical protein
MMLLDDALYKLWQDKKCTAEDVLAKSQYPEELGKRMSGLQANIMQDVEG